MARMAEISVSPDFPPGETAVSGRLLFLGSSFFCGDGFFRGGLLRLGFGGHSFYFTAV